MLLVINTLGDWDTCTHARTRAHTHTHTNTHTHTHMYVATNFADKGYFKKPGIHQPLASMPSLKTFALIGTKCTPFHHALYYAK